MRLGNVKIRITLAIFKLRCLDPILYRLICNVILISHILSIIFYIWTTILIIFIQIMMLVWNITLWSVCSDCCSLRKRRGWADKTGLRKRSREGLFWRLKLILKIYFVLRWRWIHKKPFISCCIVIYEWITCPMIFKIGLFSFLIIRIQWIGFELALMLMLV